MHWQLVALSLIVLAFAAVSGRIEGTSITPPIVFTAAGLLVGARALGFVDPAPEGHAVKLLAEATLTVVLFFDASRIDLRALRTEAGWPARLLGIGLPLTILAGFLGARCSSASSTGPRLSSSPSSSLPRTRRSARRS
jgi:NhaP-type Na+/H+ or K+/H+ antiporter